MHWSLVDSNHTTDIGLTISRTKIISTNYIDINTLSYAQGDKCKMWCGVPLCNVVNIIQNNTKPAYGCFSFCLISCNKDIPKNRINNLLVETSFHQFSNMASLGLKKMFILQFYTHKKCIRKCFPYKTFFLCLNGRCYTIW